MTSKEKFKTIVSPNTSNTSERSKNRIRNRAMLKESRKISFKILERLDDLGWSQKKLAKQMGVSPQQVNKLVKGKENITLETQVKLQSILQIPILASYYEDGRYSYISTYNIRKELNYKIYKYLLAPKVYERSMHFGKKTIKLEEKETIYSPTG